MMSNAMQRRRGIPSRKGILGFTLIELMVVVVIIGILAMIAFPSYSKMVRKSRRAAAQADLVEIAGQAERYRTVHNNYTGFDTKFGASGFRPTPSYLVRVTQSAGQTFTVEANPSTTDQALDECGRIWTDQSGRRYRSGGTTASCW